MVMDELVDLMGTRHKLRPGPDIGGFNTLAFADDLVLASGTVHGMNQQLATAREFFDARSMKVNASKSHTIRLAPAPGTRTVKVAEGSTFSIGDEPIMNRKITESVKYLGLSLSPKGPNKYDTHAVVKDLQLIQKAALKPEQKLDVIRDRTRPQGDRLTETKNINQSLASLGNVTMALGNTQDHVPFRDSKLTHLLHLSLDGNSKTLMFVKVSPSEDGAGETLNSLRLAGQVNHCHIGAATKRTRVCPRCLGFLPVPSPARRLQCRPEIPVRGPSSGRL
ncbi:Kinesin-like protein KIN-14N [Amphibalanus amphitrite]|uniref:Kinesin-like protein KIN-14N n=1 Tax=Amphibalanus amphitrite TaxID=1232801 RepID=A0A6A4VQL3_AMPAM|nr:Kinesin-like protein KIN-14N [Amphibalanus amphitrite]